MEIEGCQEIDLELEGHDLIESYQFPDDVDAKKEGNGVAIDFNDHLPELHESTEPARNQRNGRYNLRKSLAWDSAFFTNAGVLDPEELSSMFVRSDKKEKHKLPGIQEELTGSTESISTFQSDSLTLESGEDDLFLDIRASIQRSSKKASNLINPSTKVAAMVLDGSSISSPKKENFVSPNKIPKPGVKKTSGPQPLRMSKSQLKPTGKRDAVQPQAGFIGKTGVMNSAPPRPLKTMNNTASFSTAAKRDSVGTGHVKPEFGSSKQGSISGKVTQLPKVSALGGSRKVLPKSVVSSKCSALGSSTTSSVQSTRSSTSSDSSICTSSINAAKPTLMAPRRNLGKSSSPNIGTSGSIPKTPSKALPRNKLPPSTLSAYLKSTKISSNVSPASSISEWSSVSSSTSSVVNQRSNNSRTSLDTGSCRSVDGDNMHSDPRGNVAGRKGERQGNEGAISASNTLRKSSTTSGTLQAPAKPSGLRLPSPKIGFFDGSTSRTPKGNQPSQSTLRPVIPKSGAPALSTPTQSSNGKLKTAKVPTARTATSSANKKASSPKAASPASSQENSHGLVRASSVSSHGNDSSILSIGVEVSRTGETYREAVEVQPEDRVKQVVDADTGADDINNLVDLCLNKKMSSEDINTATMEDNKDTCLLDLEHISQIRDGPSKKDELNKNSILTAEDIKKEKEPTDCVLTSTAAAFDAEACRLLFENLSCSDKCVDKPTEPIVQVAVAEDTGFALPSPSLEYIDQIGDGLCKDELNKNSVQTCEAIEKENKPANCPQEGLAGDRRGACQKNLETNSQLVIDSSQHLLSFTAAACDSAAYRAPFALKNLSCTNESVVDKPTEKVVEVAAAGENACFALPSDSC